MNYDKINLLDSPRIHTPVSFLPPLCHSCLPAQAGACPPLVEKQESSLLLYYSYISLIEIREVITPLQFPSYLKRGRNLVVILTYLAPPLCHPCLPAQAGACPPLVEKQESSFLLYYGYISPT